MITNAVDRAASEYVAKGRVRVEGYTQTRHGKAVHVSSYTRSRVKSLSEHELARLLTDRRATPELRQAALTELRTRPQEKEHKKKDDFMTTAAHDRERTRNHPLFTYLDGITSGTNAKLPNGTRVYRQPLGSDEGWDNFVVYTPDGKKTFLAAHYHNTLEAMQESEDKLKKNPALRDRVEADWASRDTSSANSRNRLLPGVHGDQIREHLRQMSDAEVKSLESRMRKLYDKGIRNYDEMTAVRAEFDRRFGTAQQRRSQSKKKPAWKTNREARRAKVEALAARARKLPKRPLKSRRGRRRRTYGL